MAWHNSMILRLNIFSSHRQTDTARPGDRPNPRIETSFLEFSKKVSKYLSPAMMGSPRGEDAKTELDRRIMDIPGYDPCNCYFDQPFL